MSAAHDMIKGIEGAIWTDAWANAMEEAGTLPRGELTSQAPPVPKAAKALAKKFAHALAKFNGGTLAGIFDAANTVEPSGFDVDARELGHYLAMQGMGHGVSWFDSHPEFDVNIPSLGGGYAFKSGRSWGYEGGHVDFRFLTGKPTRKGMTWDEHAKESLSPDWSRWKARDPKKREISDSDLAWRKKAERIIAALSKESYNQAQRKKSGGKHKRHVPYSIPETAQRLVDALNRNDEHLAKSIMMYDYDAKRVS